MTNYAAKELITQLEQEITWIDQLISLLADEKQALATRQFDNLEELANQKTQIALDIEKSSQKRMAIIYQANKNQPQNSELSAFLASCSSEDAKRIQLLNDKLSEKLSECRDLNTVNGQVIANNIHTRQEIVNALSGKLPNASEVYTATGNVSRKNDQKHHQEA